MVIELGSQSKGRGFESCLFQILHGNGVQAMPGSIPVNTQSWFTENRENIGSQMGHTKKTLKKNYSKEVLKALML